MNENGVWIVAYCEIEQTSENRLRIFVTLSLNPTILKQYERPFREYVLNQCVQMLGRRIEVDEMDRWAHNSWFPPYSNVPSPVLDVVSIAHYHSCIRLPCLAFPS